MAEPVKIKIGDWVLVDHPFASDSYVVRRVVSVSNKKFVGERRLVTKRDGVVWETDNARLRSNIVGVFPGENAALAAMDGLRSLFSERVAAEQAAKRRFHASARVLLDPS